MLNISLNSFKTIILNVKLSSAVFVFVCLFAAAASLSYSYIPSPKHTFEIGKKNFLLDGKPFQIRCGELHFARIPKEYWRHRIKMMKALGMNTICAYLFWNYHERTPGVFKWDGEADVAEFCKIAQEEGLWVILRPGPYVCAEWEMGGLPWWLLKNDSIKLRTRDPLFINAAQKYLKEVGRVLAPLQITEGGPIIMVQVENEYGFYGEDSGYMELMRNAIINAGFNVPLFDCNPPYYLKERICERPFPCCKFRIKSRTVLQSIARNTSAGTIDVRRILFRLVRYMGRTAYFRQHRSIFKRYGIHVKNRRIIQYIHGARRNYIRFLVRCGQTV